MVRIGNSSGAALALAIFFLAIGPAMVEAQDVQSPLAATVVAAGGSHTCALIQIGAVDCWGYNNYDQAEPYNGRDDFGKVGELWESRIDVLIDGDVVASSPYVEVRT